MVDDQEKQLKSNTAYKHRVTESNHAISRRGFIAQGIMSAGSLSLLSGAVGISALAQSPKKGLLDLSTLQTVFKGKLFTPQDNEFNKIVFGGLWNKLSPSRAPQLVAQVNNEEDVAAIVRYARVNNLKVSVRGGGHNWYALSNRDSGILVDLSNLNKVISIDAPSRKAVLQPVVSNREVQAALKPYDLAFPTGHCPQVKLSGYLLSGGMSWNQGAWGSGTGSVEAIELVTADGQFITASETENQDYFWAARGAGPGLFAIATRYHLKLYPLPKAMSGSIYYYPYENIEQVCDWLGRLAPTLPSNVEIGFCILDAPPELAYKCKSSNGKLCSIAATVFADSREEAQAALSPLNSCPVIDKCLSKSVDQATNFEKIFDASGALWPPGLRCQADAMFYDAPLADLTKAVKTHFLTSSSPKTLIMFSVFTGKNIPRPPANAAFSMASKLYGGPWTMWEQPIDDEQNKNWHEKCVQSLLPYVSGHYISETNTVGHPDFVKASYKEANWKRLAELRKKYDPNGVFFDYSDGLS